MQEASSEYLKLASVSVLWRCDHNHSPVNLDQIRRCSLPSHRITKLRSTDEIILEIRRIEDLFSAVSTKVRNPDLDFSTSMQLAIYHKVLESYLRGIQFVIGEGDELLIEGVEGI